MVKFPGNSHEEISSCCSGVSTLEGGKLFLKLKVWGFQIENIDSMKLENEEIFRLGCRKKMGRWGFMFSSALGFMQAQG
jgi:hypothetical protein